VCRCTWPFSSRNTSSFESGGGVLVSAMARTSQRLLPIVFVFNAHELVMNQKGF